MVAGDSYLGFLELPQGAQLLVRLGSIVDGGKVIAFDADSLRIRFPDGVVELTLEGTGKPPTQSRHDVVVSGDEQGHVIRREVDLGELHAALAERGRGRQTQGRPGAECVASGRRTIRAVAGSALGRAGRRRERAGRRLC